MSTIPSLTIRLDFGDGGLAGFRRLPDLGGVVPDILRIEAAGDVGAPAAHHVRAFDGEAHHVAPAPVVADEVDRTVDLLEFGDEPGEIVVAGGAETLGHGCAEAGGRKGDDVVAAERFAQLIPDGGGFGVPMDKDDRHSASSSRGRSLGQRRSPVTSRSHHRGTEITEI